MNGRDTEFIAFATRETAGLLRMAGGLLRNAGRAEDVVQAALEQVYVRWPRLDDPLSYARRSVVNGCRDTWRVRLRHPTSITFDEAPGHPALATGADTVAVEDRATLIHALRQLPARQREVIVLRHLLGLSEAETAAALDVSLGTVKSHCSRGLVRLEAHLHTTYPERVTARRQS